MLPGVAVVAVFLASCGERQEQPTRARFEGHNAHDSVALMIEISPGKDGFPLDLRPSTHFLDDIPRSVRYKSDGALIAVPTFVGTKGNARFVARTFAMPVEVISDDLSSLLEGLRRIPEVIGVHLNPVLHHEASPTSCKLPFQGESEDVVRERIGSQWLLDRGMEGEDVLIVVVDEGFNFAHVKSHHGNVQFEPRLSYSSAGTIPGETGVTSHGTMSAFLATVAAPRATLVDLASPSNVEARCKDALVAYNKLAQQMENEKLLTRYRGVVVTNSWQTGSFALRDLELAGCYANDLPAKNGVVSVEQPCHLLNRAITALDEAGADIVFAAGNMGKCPADAPGTVFGPNSHPRVLTVAAIDLKYRRIHNSSYGPGALHRQKPDVSGYSNFDASKTLILRGSGAFLDQGTSASAALVAGIVAALRSGLGPPGCGPDPEELRQELRTAARRELIRADGKPVRFAGYDREFGWGAVRVQSLALPSQRIAFPCRP